ncbi:MAG TPA: transglutaminase-like cysteine peptidase [Devosia sp.]|nr:transglutaminase-like cysteine peptidase [Devosia sp.]
MLIRQLIIAFFVLVVAYAVSPAAQAGTAPLGYQLMCLQNPDQCKAGGAAQIKVTGDILATLKKVNSRVNRAITPRHDSGADVWSANATVGDCEDYVLAKRAALIKAGLPPSALRIAYVKTRSGEGHAILVVKSNGRDLVLDNLTSAIKPLSQTGYRIVSMSSANPTKWS